MEVITLTHTRNLSVYQDEVDGKAVVRVYGEAIQGDVFIEVEEERIEVDVNGRMVIAHRTKGLVVDGVGVKVHEKQGGYAVRVGGIIVSVFTKEKGGWVAYIDYSDERGMYRRASVRVSFGKGDE